MNMPVVDTATVEKLVADGVLLSQEIGKQDFVYSDLPKDFTEILRHQQQQVGAAKTNSMNATVWNEFVGMSGQELAAELLNYSLD